MSVTFIVTLTGIQNNSDIKKVKERIEEANSVVSVELIDLAKDSSGFLLPFKDTISAHYDFWAGFVSGSKTNSCNHHLIVNVGNIGEDLNYDKFEVLLSEVKNVDSVIKANIVLG